eukprot:5455186-Karenia_brevis.AAC.1
MDNGRDLNYYSGLSLKEHPNICLLGWTDGGSRPKERVSAYAWLLKARSLAGDVRIIAARA